MAVDERCSECAGKRGFKCASCTCPSCHGAKITQRSCEKCHGNRVLVCHACQGRGQVLKKKSFFLGETYAESYHCSGKRQISCTSCSGKGNRETSCPTCHGTGAAGGCSKCGGKGEIPCAGCGGRGRVAPNWSRERIRDEIETRKDQITELKEAIEYQMEAYDRMPQDGFQGRDLETRVYELKQEIEELRSMSR